MTKTIDNFMVKLRFDRQDLESVRTRPFLYAGISGALLLSLTFLSLIMMG